MLEIRCLVLSAIVAVSICGVAVAASGSGVLVSPGDPDLPIPLFRSKESADVCRSDIADVGKFGTDCILGVLGIEKSGTRVKVKGSGGFGSYVQVRILDGPDAGLIGWVWSFNFESPSP